MKLLFIHPSIEEEDGMNRRSGLIPPTSKRRLLDLRPGPPHRRRDYSSADSSAICPSSQLIFLLSTPKFWSCLLFLTNMMVREGVSPSYYHYSCHLAKHFQQ